MKRCLPCLLFLGFLGGCSTHPVVNLRDYFRPGRFGTNKVQPYGGVCIPQGPVTNPGMPPLPVINAPGGGGVIPPPAPLPPPGGNAPANFPN